MYISYHAVYLLSTVIFGRFARTLPAAQGAESAARMRAATLSERTVSRSDWNGVARIHAVAHRYAHGIVRARDALGREPVPLRAGQYGELFDAREPGIVDIDGALTALRASCGLRAYPRQSCQNATALAAATFSESTPLRIGMRTV